MITNTYFLLYVDSPIDSADFYSRLLDKPPAQASTDFALFILDSGIKLGLWSRQAVKPESQACAGGGELGWAVDSREAVDELHRHWQALGITIVQEPTETGFGYTLLALDPDGHRLRVLYLTAN
ncbi:VOC family protein [Pseudomonas sp. MSSRFD41]|uniref:VOC family protein n=1 Tax=unclassified Pseudomonas TaxID=196821 RepID=UPI001639C7E3|nr:VOC family protein [Pseudomonas sp. MSSRFD41]MBC2657166.1 VOC family protein [Pseudomonas sp. MSSRFD41]